MIIGSGPYEGWAVYGPYWHKKEKRFLANLVKGNERTSTSWSRYVMSMHLGYIVPDDKEVDHIDGDKTNDEIDNLQLLDKYDNIAKAAMDRPIGAPKLVTLTCPWCRKEFTRERRQTHLVKKGRNPTCCSIKCARAKQFNK